MMPGLTLALACYLSIRPPWAHRLCVSDQIFEVVAFVGSDCAFPLWPVLWSALVALERQVWAVLSMVWQVVPASHGGLRGVLLGQHEVQEVPCYHPHQCAVVVAVAEATVVGLCHHLLLLAEQPFEAVLH